MTRIIAAGSRGFHDYGLLCATLDAITAEIPDGIEIVSGHAQGADTLGERYARARGFRLKIFPADWSRYGRSAGMIRNQQMIDYARKESALAVFFWDGVSRGTLDTIRRARHAGIDTRIILY